MHGRSQPSKPKFSDVLHASPPMTLMLDMLHAPRFGFHGWTSSAIILAALRSNPWEITGAPE
eukprot:1526736-Pyramimonas_sp.AAC.1